MKPEIGTIIHATLHPRDLLPAFESAIMLYAAGRGSDAVGEYRRAIANYPDVETFASVKFELASDLVDDMIDELDELAGEGLYFGAHPGDGSDFGFWPIDLLD